MTRAAAFFWSLVAACLAIGWFTARPVPTRWAAIFDRNVRHDIDVRGGVRAEYEPRGVSLETARQRVADYAAELGIPTEVYVEGDRVVLDLPDEVDASTFARRFGEGRLEFKMVADSTDFMRGVAQRALSDPAAKAAAVTVKVDNWSHESTGSQHSDFWSRGLATRSSATLRSSRSSPDTNGVSKTNRLG